MSTSITNDSSAAAWQAQAMAAAEAYLDSLDEAAYQAQLQAQQQAQNGSSGTYQPDGMDTPSAQQRALDAFLGPDAARGGTASLDSTGGGNRTYLSPDDARLHRDAGYVVLTDDHGNAYLPPQGGHEQFVVTPTSNLPAPDRFGSSTSSSQVGSPSATPEPGVRPENPPGGVPEPVDGGAPAPEPKRLYSGGGTDVDDILNKSPSLRKLWQEASDANWKIKYRDDKVGSHADRENKVVWINKNDIHAGGDPAAKLATLLAHEIGHAGTPYSAGARIEGNTREEYVGRNTQRELEHEGAAAFHNARARDEIRANGGPDIEMRGGFDEEYRRIYEDYKSGNISQEEAISRMTYFMALEPQAIEAGRYLTKQEVLERRYNGEWNERENAQ
jgi:hypothetical protein